MLRIRLTILVIAALSVALVAGCGSSDDSSDASSGAGSTLANFASPGSVVFAEVALKPTGELKSNADSVAKKLTGKASLRDYVISQLENSAREDNESLNFAKEVEPWLGDRGGVAFERVVKGELSEPLIAVETTNAKAAQEFVDKKAAQGNKPAKDATYEGIDFKVGGEEDDAVGVIGEALVLANDEKEFKAAVDASEGDSLGGEDRFQKTAELASNGSLADVYIDVGAIVEQSEGSIDAPTEATLQSAGIDASDATAVASIIPHSDQIEIDVSSELGGEKAPSGNASKLLGSLPANAFAAFGFADFTEQLEEAIDSLDEEGIPPNVEPGEMKKTLEQAGVDLDKIAASLDEAAIFVEGNDGSSLRGAAVVTAKSSEAADAIGSLGTLLRAANVPGITAVSGKASGFSVRTGELTAVIVGKGDRIAIGSGLAPTLAALNAGSGGATLSGKPSYKAAVSALGKTPISGFIDDGPAALQLVEALMPSSKRDSWDVLPYLKKISYVGIGSGSEGELATATLIAGIGK